MTKILENLFEAFFISALLILLLGYLGYKIKRNSLKNNFVLYVTNFLFEYSLFEPILEKNISLEEMIKFLDDRLLKEGDFLKDVSCNLIIFEEKFNIKNLKEYRAVLKKYGDNIIKFQTALEEQYKFEVNESSEIYRKFIEKLVKLRTICLNDE